MALRALARRLGRVRPGPARRGSESPGPGPAQNNSAPARNNPAPEHRGRHSAPPERGRPRLTRLVAAVGQRASPERCAHRYRSDPAGTG